MFPIQGYSMLCTEKDIFHALPCSRPVSKLQQQPQHPSKTDVRIRIPRAALLHPCDVLLCMCACCTSTNVCAACIPVAGVPGHLEQLRPGGCHRGTLAGLACAHGVQVRCDAQQGGLMIAWRSQACVLRRPSDPADPALARCRTIELDHFTEQHHGHYLERGD